MIDRTKGGNNASRFALSIIYNNKNPHVNNNREGFIMKKSIKRTICLTACILLIFTGTLGRLAYIVFSNEYTVSQSYNSYSLSLETLYPTVYYSGGERLSNNSESYIAVIKPAERTLSDLHNLFSSSEINSVTKELQKGYPIIRTVNRDKKDDAKYIKVYEAAGNDFASPQLFSSASSGLMSYIEPYGERKIRFSVDALGRILRGDEGEEYEESYSSEREIRLSYDKEVESIVIQSTRNLKSGCVVVMNVEDSSILSCVTKPDSSYINKATEQFSVGSVFKIVVAACALENNLDFFYTCTGKCGIGDVSFSCHKNHIHGFENLKTALANSCNCYFVNLALKLGRDKLLETARSFGFDEDIILYDGWKIKGSCLPDNDALKSKGELALFGFGQGRLTSSPLQICSSLCTVANSGMRNAVHFALNTVNDRDEINEIIYPSAARAISNETSAQLLKYLRYVVTNGTGAAAQDSANQAAGKTATAQTGQYFFGREKLNTWFAGVYPYDAPRYAIVVMAENGSSGSEDCAPIYRDIVEKLKNI